MFGSQRTRITGTTRTTYTERLPELYAQHGGGPLTAELPHIGGTNGLYAHPTHLAHFVPMHSSRAPRKRNVVSANARRAPLTAGGKKIAWNYSNQLAKQNHNTAKAPHSTHST